QGDGRLSRREYGNRDDPSSFVICICLLGHSPGVPDGAPSSAEAVARIAVIVLFAYFVVALLVYINILTKAIFLIHESTLTAALRNLIAPETAASGSGSNLGRTFTQIEIGRVVATLLGLCVIAFSYVVRHRA